VTFARALGKLRAMTLRPHRALLLTLAALAQACTGGTETGNPPFVAALSYTGFSSEPERISVREAGSAIVVRQAWLDLESVSLSAGSGCETSEDVALTVPGLGVGDHAAGAHVSTSFEATPAAFCRVTLPFARAADTAAGPRELAGNSVLLLGELADGTPFSIASRATPTFELQAAAGSFRLDPEQHDILFAFDFAAWLSDLDFSGAERQDGKIVVDGERNAALGQLFEQSLSRGISLHRDRDGDGQLDPSSQPIAAPR